MLKKKHTWKICSFSANYRIKHTIRVIYTIIRYTQCILKYTCNTIYILFVAYMKNWPKISWKKNTWKICRFSADDRF